jgi:hypothetical protein
MNRYFGMWGTFLKSKGLKDVMPESQTAAGDVYTQLCLRLSGLEICFPFNEGNYK